MQINVKFFVSLIEMVHSPNTVHDQGGYVQNYGKGLSRDTVEVNAVFGVLKTYTFSVFPSVRLNNVRKVAFVCAMDVNQLRGHSVVLGTSSKWRRALFAEHFKGVPYTHASPDIDEQAAGGERNKADATKLTTTIAHAKSDALLTKFNGQRVLLVCMDQVVIDDTGAIREKPISSEQARTFLRSYYEHPVTTVTAIVVTECLGGQRVEAVDIASLELTPLPEDVIEKLIEKGDVLHSAGGVTVEDELVTPYHGKLTGELESILGMPVATTWRLLTQAADSTST